MSQEPKVTRFGADPTVDQELATKAYVDNSSPGGGFSTHIFGGYQGNGALASDLFGVPSTWVIVSGSETSNQVAAPGAGTYDNLTVNVGTNTRSVAPHFRLRINAVNGNLDITISASTTGVFSDTVNSDTVVIEDLIAWMYDDNGGTGSIIIRTVSMRQTA